MKIVTIEDSKDIKIKRGDSALRWNDKIAILRRYLTQRLGASTTTTALKKRFLRAQE
jgi:hypothetical protein